MIAINKTKPFSTEQDTADSGSPGSLSLFQSFSYALPIVGTMCLLTPTNILQGIYAKYYGFSLTTIALIILLVRIFDVVTDPMIGFYADRYQRRHNTRKPFIVAGVLLLLVSSYFLYVPYGVDVDFIMTLPDLDGPVFSTAYLVGWFLLLYLGSTLFDIPHISWATDIAKTAADKSRVYSFRSGAGYVGMILFYSIPLLPVFGSSDITPETLRVSMIVAGVLVLPLLYVCMRHTPNASLGAFNKDNDKTVSVKAAVDRRGVIASIVRNKPLRIFLAASVFFQFGIGLWYGVIFFYVDSYLNMGEQFAPMFLVAFFVGVAATPIFYRLSLLFGKKAMVGLSGVFFIASYLYSGILIPGETSVAALMSLKIINTLGHVCLWAMAPAMLSEIADYSELKFRSQNTGMYFSLFLFVQKTCIAIGAAVGLAILGWFGYDATATSQVLEATQGLMLVVVWIPAVLALMALILIALNPINVRRYRIVRCRLDALASRSARNISSQNINFSQDKLHSTSALILDTDTAQPRTT